MMHLQLTLSLSLSLCLSLNSSLSWLCAITDWGGVR